MILLKVANLSKAFYTYKSEWMRFARWFGFKTKTSSEVYVLKDINFEIKKGEAIGIIGINGAGKSTLLKLITGTLIPTKGSVTVNGRISAMLELGMGFNTDLTGRSNVLHTGGMMGFTNQQMLDKMAEIESFAEIGEYFDQPVRVYSSGMQMRVAFAVATVFRPEILIVDEALSVGDSYFQHKSFARIKQFQKEGTTLLIVSHDKGAIQTLCNRAILLSNGSILKDGAPEEVFDYYNAIIADKEGNSIRIEKTKSGKVNTISGNGYAVVENIQLLNSKGESAEVVFVAEDVCLDILVRVNKPLKALVLGYSIKDRLGNTIYGTNTHHTKQVMENISPSLISYKISFKANLGLGTYAINTALTNSENHMDNNYEFDELSFLFEVVNSNEDFIGCSYLPAIIEVDVV